MDRYTTTRTQKNTVRRSSFSEAMSSPLELTLTWFEVLGYTVLLQSDIVSGRHQAILRGYRGGILGDRFREAMARINRGVSSAAIDRVLEELINPLDLGV